LNRLNQLTEIHQSGKPYIIYKSKKGFNLYTNFSKKIITPKQLSSSIIFKKNIKSGIKIKNIGEKILKKTINELDKHIVNEFKKT